MSGAKESYLAWKEPWTKEGRTDQGRVGQRDT